MLIVIILSVTMKLLYPSSRLFWRNKWNIWLLCFCSKVLFAFSFSFFLLADTEYFTACLLYKIPLTLVGVGDYANNHLYTY